MHMDYHQLRLLSDVASSMSFLLDHGAEMKDLRLWTAGKIDQAVEFNNRSLFLKAKDFFSSVFIPFKSTTNYLKGKHGKE